MYSHNFSLKILGSGLSADFKKLEKRFPTCLVIEFMHEAWLQSQVRNLRSIRLRNEGKLLQSTVVKK